MNLKNVFAVGTGAFLLLFAASMFLLPSTPIEANQPVPPSPPVAAFFLYGLLLALACVATYMALKHLEGLRMIVSVLIAWIIPVFGPIIVFLLATSESGKERRTALGR